MISAILRWSTLFFVADSTSSRARTRPNAATIFIPLKPWGRTQGIRDDVAKYIFAHAGEIPQASVLAVQSAAFAVWVRGRLRGLSAGSCGMPTHRSCIRHCSSSSAICASGPDRPAIASFYRPTAPQLFVDVDREKAIAPGVPIKDVFSDALQRHDGRAVRQRFHKIRPYVSGSAAGGRAYRAKPEDLGNVYVARRVAT